jgi:hypothetical protein
LIPFYKLPFLKKVDFSMYRTRSIFTLLLASLLLPVTAQISTTSGTGYNIMNTRNLEPYETQVIDGVATAYYSDDLPPMIGSPYLDEQFVEGVLTVREGTRIEGLKYRYVMYGDRMQMIVNSDTSVIDRPLAVKSIETEEHKFVYDVFMVRKDQVATSYFEIIEETESMTILQRHRIEFKQDIYVPNYGGGGGTKEFMMVRKDAFYMKLGEGAALYFENRKGFLDRLTVLKAQVKNYIKENHLSVKKEEDLRQIANYYNDLIFSRF